MNFLLFIDSLGSGGAQRQCVTLAKMLKEQNHNVAVLCYSKETFFAAHLEGIGVPIHWKIENNYLKRIFRIRRFIRRGKYDAVISYMDVPNFLNCFSAVGGKSWKVITGERSAKEGIFSTKQGKIFAWFQRYTDHLVCNSHNAKNMWLKYYPQYKNKLEIIYNPVILPEITSNYIPRKDDKLHVVIAASYQYLKNPIGLVRAIALLNETEREKLIVNWYGRIEPTPGDTRAYDEAMDLVQQHNLQDVIRFNKLTKNIINRMNEADIIALLSELEGLPNTVLEGMMIGKPIIMSRMSDYKELVDTSNGFLCDWDNPVTIKEAFVSAMNLSEKQINEMGIHSKEKAKHLFSKDIIVQQWINIIEK